MNNKAIYWTVGAVIVVILIVVLATSGKQASTPATTGTQGANSSIANASSSTSDQSGQTNQTTASAARQTIHDLIASGATETCTFSIPATGAFSSLSGTVYMSSGSTRGDFVKTDTTNKTVNSHMIIANGITYLWTDALSKGVKLSWAIAASSSAMLGKAGGIDVNQPTDYSCTSQTPDQSLFTLPANITFTDITAFVKSRATTK